MTQLATAPCVVGTPPRYSVVRDAKAQDGGWSLTVETPARAHHLLRFACTRDVAATDSLRRAGLRPLALRIDVEDPRDPVCSALFSSTVGPQRRRISLGAALALCADGVRSVVTRTP